MGLQPGERFGRYELVFRLGHGGMAETWRARLLGAASVTKPVLIKRILPEYAGGVPVWVDGGIERLSARQPQVHMRLRNEDGQR